MGLRNWVKRPIRGHQFGVEDLTAGGSGIPVSVARSDFAISPSIRICTNVVARRQGVVDGRLRRSMPLPFRYGLS